MHIIPTDVLDGGVRWSLYAGDCRLWLPTVPTASVDAVVCDPPYPEIDRDYGRLTEPQWHALMDVVVPECRRVLKPRGSAVFVLQANSERLGRARTWLWEFMARWGAAWGIIQDVWWWNTSAPPTKHVDRTVGLLRPSLKACVWLGPPDCFRAQDRVLWTESERNAARRAEARALGEKGNDIERRPSGHRQRLARMAGAAVERGGVTPFNLLPIAATNSMSSGAAFGHGAATPPALTAWWVRYLCPKGGVVLDPFTGSGTTGLEALKDGASFLGCEGFPKHAETARVRLEAACPRGV